MIGLTGQPGVTTVPVPLTYRGIAADIEARIRSGEYPPGTKLPSYTELADLYSVSISTAQRSIGLLQDRGLVVGAIGRGLYVADSLPPAPPAPRA